MKLKAFALAGAVALGFGGTANAAIVLSDNFNSETQALNYTGFANWTVTAGSVDVIGSPPPFFDFYPGNGRYVDLDGSTNQAGTLTSNTTFGPGNYTLSFSLGGSQRPDGANSVAVSLGSVPVAFITLNATDPLSTYTYTFNALTSGRLSFASLSGNDNQGLILDNVQLSSGVPELSTWAMMLIGFAGLGALSTRRRNAALA